MLGWLSLFALLFNLAGAVTVPAAAGTVDSALHALCTAGGMVPLQQPDGGAQPDAAAGGVTCVFCLPLLHGATAPVAAIQPAAPAQTATLAFAAAPAAAHKLRRLTLPASPRAPPL